MERDELFIKGDPTAVWQKYCGFLDLSLQEFMEIQNDLLLEDIHLVANTPLGEKIMKHKRPTSVTEFRHLVPLTTYEDYAADLQQKREDVLSEKPYLWAHTSGKSGSSKWVPQTRRAWEKAVDYSLGAFLLACANQRGEINLHEGDHALYNIAPRPYFSGFIAHSLIERMSLKAIPPIEIFESLSFQERIEIGFSMALRTGVQLLGSMASVLVKIGESFAERSGTMKFSASMLHPAVLFRIARALLRSRLQKRKLLPKDLWPVRGITCVGTDTAIYKDQIEYYWGRTPAEFYAATETGILAMQSWNKRWMTFVPASSFFEFIPEEEWMKNREDKEYQPSTVLLDEVEVGKRYEVVATSFYGMPFLRYRVGDMIKIVALRDEQTGTELPQMVFQSRADDIIDIAGFTRLDEITIWQAIASTGIKYEDWTIRKEYEQNQPILHLYIELKESRDTKELEHIVHDQLKAVDPNYRDLDTMLKVRPLRITPLTRGTFQRYIKEKQAAGVDPGWLKPAHLSAPDIVVEDLLRSSRMT